MKNTTSRELIESHEDVADFSAMGNVRIPFASDMMASLQQAARSEDQADAASMSCSTVTGAICQFVDTTPSAGFYRPEDEQSEQSSSSSGSDEDEENGESKPRRRKRKTSMSRSPYPCVAKKFCVEERQLSGLISVFNSGLSVVADQLLPRSGSSPLLQQSSEQLVPSLVRIAYNPLICK